MMAMPNTLNNLPVLYSFRRCPFAIRARMSLAHCSIQVELREVLLNEKPSAMLAASVKGSVPVLVLQDATILDESLDIMRWAINRSYPGVNDPRNWLIVDEPGLADRLININDTAFKTALDGYKYGRLGHEKSPKEYRTDAEVFLGQLEALLEQNSFLLGDKVSLADVAIFPFIRQFAGVDQSWFYETDYRKLQQWLTVFLQSELFTQTMLKHAVWKEKTMF